MATSGSAVASRPRARRRVLTPLAVVLVAVTAAYGRTRDRHPTGRRGHPAAAPAASALDWKPCSNPAFDRWKRVDGNDLDGFESATFARPLDRSRPKGKQVELAVVKSPATGPASERTGTLFLNPGGPGQSGVGLSDIVYLLPESVRTKFDFVTYDPAGSARPPACARARLQHSQAEPARNRARQLAIGPGHTSTAGRARQRALLRREPALVEHRAPATVRTTWTRCAPRSATRRSPTGGSPRLTARVHLRPALPRARAGDGLRRQHGPGRPPWPGSSGRDRTRPLDRLLPPGERAAGEVRSGDAPARPAHDPAARRDAVQPLGRARHAQRRRRLLPDHR